jgi:hypothetical protein
MRYRIHRIKAAPYENFRWASHTGGLAVVKLKDYEAGQEIESASPYAAWIEMRAAGAALRPGDLLETVADEGQSSALLITKYIGFEPAQWFIPAAKTELISDNNQGCPSEIEILSPLP